MQYCTAGINNQGDVLGTIYLRGKHFLFLFLLLFLEEVATEYENSFSFGLFFVSVYSNSNVQLEQYMTVLLGVFTHLKLYFKSRFVSVRINSR